MVMSPAAARSAVPKPQSAAAPMTAPSMDRRHHPPRARARVGRETRYPVTRNLPFMVTLLGRTASLRSRIAHGTLGKVISYVLMGCPRCQLESTAGRGIGQLTEKAIMNGVDAHYRSLRGRHVIVTGGASGIGESIVEHFAAQEAMVTFLDLQRAAG